MDGADIGGSNFERENGAELFGFEFREGTLVLPEVGEACWRSF